MQPAFVSFGNRLSNPVRQPHRALITQLVANTYYIVGTDTFSRCTGSKRRYYLTQQQCQYSFHNGLSPSDQTIYGFYMPQTLLLV